MKVSGDDVLNIGGTTEMKKCAGGDRERVEQGLPLAAEVHVHVCTDCERYSHGGYEPAKEPFVCIRII